MALIADAMGETRARFPEVRFQLYSGSTVDLMDGFARGAYDFLVECELRGHVGENVLELPIRDRWGVLVKKDSALANRKSIAPEDLTGIPLIAPRQALSNGTLAKCSMVMRVRL